MPLRQGRGGELPHLKPPPQAAPAPNRASRAPRQTFVLDNPANPGCSDEYCNASSPIRWIWRAGKKIAKPCGFHDYHGPAYPASEMVLCEMVEWLIQPPK